MEESFEFRNKRIKSQDEEDRISALPDSILQHILSFFPSTRQSIRTSVLSKRWQNQWTHVPLLIFEPRDKDNGFIENALMLHDCSRIQKLDLEYNFHSDPLFVSKIRLAFRKHVEDLALTNDSKESYLLPKFLSESASLVRLVMENCHFMPSWRVDWPSLKSLAMDCRALSLDNDTSHGIENVVSGCPLLEFLDFRGNLGDHEAIVSKSLKILSLIDVKIHAGFKISCPNLAELQLFTDHWMPSTVVENALLGSPFIHTLELYNFSRFGNLVIASKSLKVLCLKLFWEHSQPIKIEVSCPNLEKLDILSSYQRFHVENSSIFAEFDISFPMSDDSVNKMMEQFRDLNKLRNSLFWITSEPDVEFHLSFPIVNFKCVTLNVGGSFGFAFAGIAYALCFPALETLCINLDSKSHEEDISHLWSTREKDLLKLIISKSKYLFSNESDGLACLASHLKTVKIVGLNEKDDECKLALEFIEFILKNGRALKKMIVSLQEPGASFEFEVFQKLLSFPRDTHSAIVELCTT